MKISNSRKGFTLIELLVVIGILGILAAGLLAAIDPLEQLKKGRDTTKRNIGTEYVNALTRYYAIYGTMPWGATPPSGAALTSLAATVTQTLVNLGELKPEFSRALPASAATNELKITGLTTGASYVCFDPESKAISADPATIYSAYNPPTTAAVGACNATSVCYYCAR